MGRRRLRRLLVSMTSASNVQGIQHRSVLQQAFPDPAWLAKCLELDDTHPQRQSQDDDEEDLEPVPNTRASTRMAQATKTIN